MKKALCIGIKDYDFVPSLKNPINDARSVSSKLQQLGFETTLLENPDRVSFLKEYKNFKKETDSSDVSLIYYAGHGIQSGGINYLIPKDANPTTEDELDIFCVKLDQIIDQSEPNIDRVSLIILDACRDNPFSRNWSRSIRDVGFAPTLAPSGTLISFSTSPGKTASDGLGQNGLFTKIFVAEITKPDLSIIQIFQNVRQKVLFESNNKQLPWESTSLLGDFYFSSSLFNPTDLRVLRLRKRIAKLNEKMHTYKISEIEAMDESTEGGTIYKYETKNGLVKIEKRLYGEGGRFFQDIYLTENNPVYYQISNHKYNVPIYIDEKKAKELNCDFFDDSKTQIEIEEFFFENNVLIGYNSIKDNEKKMETEDFKDRANTDIAYILEQIKDSNTL